MAERRASKASAPAPPMPWWRRRRFWQAVIVVEIAVALAVSIVAADGDTEARSAPGGVALSHYQW